MATVERTVQRFPDGAEVTDHLAIEEPLEIRVEGTALAVTMRTPGHDLDLAAGFLYSEGIIDGADDLAALAHTGEQPNTVDCVLAGGVAAHADALSRSTRELYATSSCGICGKASIDRIHIAAPPIERRPELSPDLLASLPAILRAHQPDFALTGGLHAAGLFAFDGTLELVREDIGRHNAVDKVLGARLRADNAPVDDRVLVMSSRASFEIVQKALVARVPVIVCVGAASSLAADLAEASGMGLYGFARQGRCTRYA